MAMCRVNRRAVFISVFACVPSEASSGASSGTCCEAWCPAYRGVLSYISHRVWSRRRTSGSVFSDSHGVGASVRAVGEPSIPRFLPIAGVFVHDAGGAVIAEIAAAINVASEVVAIAVVGTKPVGAISSMPQDPSKQYLSVLSPLLLESSFRQFFCW